MTQPRSLQIGQLGAAQAPIQYSFLPLGKYASVSITISSASLVYLSGTQAITASNIPALPQTVTVPLNPALVVLGGGNAPQLAIDFDIAQSFGLTGGNVTFTPVVTVAGDPVALTSLPIEVAGVVTETAPQYNSISFAPPDTQISEETVVVTDSTLFNGDEALATVQPGAAITALALVRPSGLLNAVAVDVTNGGRPLGANQRVDRGMVTSVTTDSSGTLQSFTMVSQMPLLPPGTNATLGETLTVSVGTGTTFALSPAAKLAGMPSFDASEVFPGAGVLVSSSGTGSGTGPSATAVTASVVEPAAVSPFGGASAAPQPIPGGYEFGFQPEILDPSAALAGQSPWLTVTNAATQLGPASIFAITAGTSLTVHGFVSLASGNYTVYAASVLEESH